MSLKEEEIQSSAMRLLVVKDIEWRWLMIDKCQQSMWFRPLLYLDPRDERHVASLGAILLHKELSH